MRALIVAKKNVAVASEELDPGVYSLKIDADLVQPLKMAAAGKGMSTSEMESRVNSSWIAAR